MPHRIVPPSPMPTPGPWSFCLPDPTAHGDVPRCAEDDAAWMAFVAYATGLPAVEDAA